MENKFIRAVDVARELSVSKPYAYKLTRQLNEELKEQGFITIAGRANRQYFYERLYEAGQEQGKEMKQMPIFKNEDNGTLYVMARYVNWKGKRKQKYKRGFATKKEAQEWERMFLLQTSSDLDVSFEAFTERYVNDIKNRLKENTWLTKENIIRTKILPYFGKLKISEISTKEVIAWQNEMLAYRDEKKKPYSQTYLKTLYNQL